MKAHRAQSHWAQKHSHSHSLFAHGTLNVAFSIIYLEIFRCEIFNNYKIPLRYFEFRYMYTMVVEK